MWFFLKMALLIYKNSVSWDRKKDNMSLLKTTITRIISVSIISIIFGFLTFQGNVFVVSHPGFGFIILPIIGSIVFSLSINNRKRDMIYAAAILILLDIFVTTTFNYQMILTHIIFIIFFLTGIILFANFFDKMKKTKYIRPLVLAALLAISLPLANTLLWLIYTPDNMHWHLFQNLPYGFVMGLGIGIGIELTGKFIENNYLSKIWKA